MKHRLQEVQDDQRLKSLELREKLVAEKEQLLADPSLWEENNLLEKQIAFKQKIRANLNRKIKQAEVAYTQQQKFKEHRELEISKLADKLESSRADLSSLTSQQKTALRELETIQQKVTDRQEEVRELKKYLKDQQAVVDTAIAEMNAQLTTFKHEADQIEQSKVKTSQDIILLTQRKDEAEAQTKAIEGRLNDLQVMYSERAEVYKQKLNAIKDNIHRAEQHILDLDLQAKARIKVMLGREQALAIKEKSVAKQDEELSLREQRLKMQVALSGLNDE